MIPQQNFSDDEFDSGDVAVELVAGRAYVLPAAVRRLDSAVVDLAREVADDTRTVREIEERQARAVAVLRSEGVSWGSVAVLTGMTGTGAQARFTRLLEELDR